MTLRIFTKGNERKIKRNLRHFPVIFSEQESHSSLRNRVYLAPEKSSFTEKARKERPVKLEEQIK